MDAGTEATILQLANEMSKSLAELEDEVGMILKRSDAKPEPPTESRGQPPSVVAEIINSLEWNNTKFNDLISQMRSGIFNRLG